MSFVKRTSTILAPTYLGLSPRSTVDHVGLSTAHTRTNEAHYGSGGPVHEQRVGYCTLSTAKVPNQDFPASGEYGRVMVGQSL